MKLLEYMKTKEHLGAQRSRGWKLREKKERGWKDENSLSKKTQPAHLHD